MMILFAIILIILSLLGISFFEMSKIWMTAAFAFAAISIIFYILYKLFLNNIINTKLLNIIRIGLLLISMVCLVLSGSSDERGGYSDYRACMDDIIKAYEDGDGDKADSLLVNYLDEIARAESGGNIDENNDEKSDAAKKLVSTNDFVSLVNSAQIADKQKEGLLFAKAGYLYGQEKTEEMKSVLDAVSDKKSEGYLELYISYLYSSYKSEEELYRELEKVYTEAADLYPDNYGFQLGAGLMNIETQNYNTAEIYLEKARGLTSDPAVVDLARTVLWYRSGDIEQAKLFLEDVKKMADNGFGPEDMQEGISEVQGWLDEADENNAEAQ